MTVDVLPNSVSMRSMVRESQLKSKVEIDVFETLFTNNAAGTTL